MFCFFLGICPGFKKKPSTFVCERSKCVLKLLLLPKNWYIELNTFNRPRGVISLIFGVQRSSLQTQQMSNINDIMLIRQYHTIHHLSILWKVTHFHVVQVGSLSSKPTLMLNDLTLMHKCNIININQCLLPNAELITKTQRVDSPAVALSLLCLTLFTNLA